MEISIKASFCEKRKEKKEELFQIINIKNKLGIEKRESEKANGFLI